MKEFLGTGMKFPPAVNPATGRFATASAEDSVRESIYLILMTQRGERWLLPEFGSQLMGYTFIDVSATTLNLIRGDLISTIRTLEPRVAEVDVQLTPNHDGALVIDIRYLVAGSNTVGNLVFPFYLFEPEQPLLTEGEAL